MKMGKLAGAIALASAMGIVAAAPAGAGVHATAASQAAFCDPMSAADARVFGGSVTGGNALVGRGGTVREPDLSQTHQDMPASAGGRRRSGIQASTPVASCGAPTGLDSGEPRWRRKIDSTAIEPTARNSDCQFCSVRFQKSELPR